VDAPLPAVMLDVSSPPACSTSAPASDSGIPIGLRMEMCKAVGRVRSGLIDDGWYTPRTPAEEATVYVGARRIGSRLPEIYRSLYQRS
jgi:hypothetical protein